MLILVLGSPSCACQRATVPISAASFPDVSPQRRERLAERLDVYIQALSLHQWQEAYDCLTAKEKQEPLESYIRWMKLRQEKLEDFTIEHVAVILKADETEFLEIMGCGRHGYFPYHEHWMTSIQSRWENGDWFFSEPQLYFQGLDGPPAPCEDIREK